MEGRREEMKDRRNEGSEGGKFIRISFYFDVYFLF